MKKLSYSRTIHQKVNSIFTLGLAGMMSVALCQAVDAQETNAISQIAWQHGPAVVELGDQATMNLPKGFVFTGAGGATKFLELTQNPPSGRELGILASEDVSWFAILSFSKDGYVRDDEKDSLDANGMLVSIQQVTEEANKERKQRGWGSISVLGWMQPPHYDGSTHNLEWSIKGRDEDGQVVVNHFTRLLGRHGIMTVDFVADTASFQTQIVSFQQAMRGFAYTAGNSYSAFVQGDKVAEYGLSALVVGGATAVAANAGLFKYLYKLIVAAIVGIGGLLKKLFSSRQNRGTSEYR